MQHASTLSIVIDVLALIAVTLCAIDVVRWRLWRKNNALLVVELGLLYAVTLRALLLYQALTDWELPGSVELFSLFYIFIAIGIHLMHVADRRDK